VDDQLEHEMLQRLPFSSACHSPVPIRALQDGLCRVLRGFVSFQRVLIKAQRVSHLTQIDCFKRAPVPSLEEPCSDSRGCQVLAPGESLL
jgi:hypothetical protein